VGIRSDLGYQPTDVSPAKGLLPSGLKTAPDLVDVIGDLVDPRWSPGVADTPRYPQPARSDMTRWFRTTREGRTLRAGALLTEHEYSKHTERVLARFAAIHHSGGYVPTEMQTKKFAQRLLPSRWGPGGANITVASLPDDYVHFSQPRTLTVREWARLQTFPDWYEFVGKRTTGGRRRAGDPEVGDWSRELPKFTQIGNAVPVFLAKQVGEHLDGVLRHLHA
jgi:DNA (cytosine-5)-methyltransferase 1